MKVGKTSTNKTEVRYGKRSEMLKQRENELPRLIKGIEEFLEDYIGGGIVICKNQHDQNGEVSQVDVLITGMDMPKGMIKMAKATHDSSREIIDMMTEALPPRELSSAMIEVLGGLKDDD